MVLFVQQKRDKEYGYDSFRQPPTVCSNHSMDSMDIIVGPDGASSCTRTTTPLVWPPTTGLLDRVQEKFLWLVTELVKYMFVQSGMLVINMDFLFGRSTTCTLTADTIVPDSLNTTASYADRGALVNEFVAFLCEQFEKMVKETCTYSATLSFELTFVMGTSSHTTSSTVLVDPRQGLVKKDTPAVRDGSPENLDEDAITWLPIPPGTGNAFFDRFQRQGQ